MCRNITTLRGLDPPATPEEIEGAARQYVRKVSGVQSTSAATEAAFESAVVAVTRATATLLAELPPRRNPPPTVPPLRRLRAAHGSGARVGAATAGSDASGSDVSDTDGRSGAYE